MADRQINNNSDATREPSTPDDWAARLSHDRNSYDVGTHQKMFWHDLASAQSFVHHYLPKVDITGFEDGHLVGVDGSTNQWVSLRNVDEPVSLGTGDGQARQTPTDHQAQFSPDGSGVYKVGKQDRSGVDVARSILKDRGIPGGSDVDPSNTQIANFQRDILRANGRHENDSNWFRHLKPGQEIKVPAGQFRQQSNQPTAPDASIPAYTQPTASQGDTAPSFAHGDATQQSVQGQQPAAADVLAAEQAVKADVQQQNRQLDAAYALLLKKGQPITDALVQDVQNTQGLTDDQIKGLDTLHKHFADVGAPVPYHPQEEITQDSLNQFKYKQEAATWLNAGKNKNNPLLAAEMKDAQDAFNQFSSWVGGIGGHKAIAIDIVNTQVAQGVAYPQWLHGLQFMQRNFNDMARGNDVSGISQSELDSWTKLN